MLQRHCCRCARGSEFPELAKALLTGNGNYQPDFPIDIWAFGQLILELLKARLPEAHTAVLQDQAYLDGLQSSDNPRQVPGLRAHLEYLATLEEHNYAQQVGFCYSQLACLSVCMSDLTVSFVDANAA